MQSFKIYALSLLTFLGACNLNVDASIDDDDESSKSSGASKGAGKCALFSIVGEFEGGITFRPDCVLEVPGDKLTFDMRNGAFDTNFAVPTVIHGYWFSDQAYERCTIQELDSELLINCGEFDYRGFRIEE
tara:strand:+ start:152 stop:544 length:393 start_codon:yes stop_codon:yes gene_type:complete